MPKRDRRSRTHCSRLKSLWMTYGLHLYSFASFVDLRWEVAARRRFRWIFRIGRWRWPKEQEWWMLLINSQKQNPFDFGHRVDTMVHVWRSTFLFYGREVCSWLLSFISINSKCIIAFSSFEILDCVIMLMFNVFPNPWDYFYVNMSFGSYFMFHKDK